MSLPKGLIVERVIGTGAMASLLLARIEATGRRVAVKLLLPRHMANAEVAERFVLEGETMASLESSYVPKVHWLGNTENGQPYIVMDYLEGTDLDDVVRSPRRLTVAEAVRYVRDACEGVAAVHERGIVHRDLKPANLLLATLPSGKSRVMVVDFGIAKLTPSMARGRRTDTTLVLGTSHYMSPEQMQCSAGVDARADVWSLGVVLFELMTKRLPFDAPSPLALVQSISHDEPAVLSFSADIPPLLSAIVARCLSRSPRARFDSARDLADALATCPLGDGPVFANATGYAKRRASSDAHRRVTRSQSMRAVTETPPSRR